jgi:GTP pyrophosphokinase
MQRRGVELNDIYDIMALRILTGDNSRCYHALGIVHSLFVPIPTRFKDFVANPKANMYQSIHTTVVGPNGEPVEIQLRTREMHRIAEEGIAAHWKYKEGTATEKHTPWDDQVKWVREVIDLGTGEADPVEFMEHVKLELFESEVFVFTPKGDVVRLPGDATGLDFAFAVHTDVGLHCQGVKVNGRIVPLQTRLRSGDTIEIITNPNRWPSQNWLRLVKTARARTRIRRYLREQQSEQSIRLGQELLERELKKTRQKMPRKEELTDLAQSMGYESPEEFFEAIGRGSLKSLAVARKLFPEPEEGIPDGFIQKLVDRARSTVRGVSVQGEGNMMISFARCCQPIPGDKIVGYITRGRGVTVHRRDCQNVIHMLEEEDRIVDVAWDAEKDQSFIVGISVQARDRSNLLGDIGRAISSIGSNIRSASMDTEGDEAMGRFVISVRNLQQLQRVIKNLRRLKGVERVERITGGIDRP